MTFSATVAREMGRIINGCVKGDEDCSEETLGAQCHGMIRNNTLCKSMLVQRKGTCSQG